MKFIGMAPPERPGYNRWFDAGRSLGVYLNADLVDRLTEDAGRYVYGGEAGGILLGKLFVEPTASIVIDSVEYLNGEGFSEALEKLPSRPDSQPVGCVRIDTREWPKADPPDSGWFSRGESVFMVVHPYRVGLCIASLFYRDGAAAKEYPNFEFPLVQQLPGRPTVNWETPPVAPAAPAGGRLREQRSRRSHRVATGAVAAAAMLGCVLAYRLRGPGASPVPIPTGVPAYHASEPAPIAAGQETSPAVVRPLRRERPPATGERGQASRSQTALSSSAPVGRPASLAEKLPAQPPSSPGTSQPELPPPPAVQPALTQSAQPLPAVPPPPVRAASEAVAPAAARPSQAPNTAALDITGPVLIKSVAPGIRPDVRRMLASEVVVQVRVDIDARGVVTNATFLTSSVPFAGLLAPPVLAAASQYRFKPARIRGREVPSQMVLSFRFSR